MFPFPPPPSCSPRTSHVFVIAVAASYKQGKRRLFANQPSLAWSDVEYGRRDCVTVSPSIYQIGAVQPGNSGNPGNGCRWAGDISEDRAPRWRRTSGANDTSSQPGGGGVGSSNLAVKCCTRWKNTRRRGYRSNDSI